MTGVGYLEKCCSNCSNISLGYALCSSTIQGFKCSLTGEQLTHDGLCDNYNISKRAKIVLEDNGVLLSRDELYNLGLVETKEPMEF